MKIQLKLGPAFVLCCLGYLAAGCDSETHPDQHLVDSMNSQRSAQPAGQTPAPPTNQGK